MSGILIEFKLKKQLKNMSGIFLLCFFSHWHILLLYFLPQKKFSSSFEGLKILTASSACLLYDFTFACNLSTKSCSLRTFLRSSSVWGFEKNSLYSVQWNEPRIGGKINHFGMMAGGPGVNLVNSEPSSVLLTVATLAECPLCAGTVLGNSTHLWSSPPMLLTLFYREWN